MNIKHRQKYEMLLRVRDFGNTHHAAFSESIAGQQAFAAVRAAVDELAGFDLAKLSASISRRADGTRAARTALRELLGHVSHLAKIFRAGGLETPSFELPKSRSDHDLRMTGRQFARDAKALASEFTAHGLAPSRIARVTTAFETAIRDRGNGRGAHLAARLQIDVLLKKAHLDVQRLDVIIANGIDADAPMRAVWEHVRRIEERRHRRTVGAEEAPTAVSTVVSRAA